MLSNWFAASTHGERRVLRRRFAPRLELLEGRALPSTFTVLNLADAGEGSLRQAVLDANALPGPDTVRFADGLAGTIPLAAEQLSINGDLTIDGPGADLLAVSGSQKIRVFGISRGWTVTIAGLTITDGRATGDGGGVLNSGSTLNLDRVVLVNNQAAGAAGGPGRGGAVANVSGANLTVTDSVLAGNQTRGGAGGGQGFAGGILNQTSRLAVSRSTFVDNQAVGGTGGGPARGGGIDTTGGSATVTDSTFIANQAVAGDGGGGLGFGRGGGIYNLNGTLRIGSSEFVGNLARGGSNITRGGPLVGPAGGGGIFNADKATIVVTGSTFTGNRAVGGSNNASTGGSGVVGTAFGAGLHNSFDATIADCLFEHNEARGGGGNQGDGTGTSFQFVGTAMGGAISSLENNSGDPVSLTLTGVTLRHNRAVGGDGNTAGTFIDSGIGGGLMSYGVSAFVPVSGGSTTTLRDSTVAHNQAVGGSGGAALGGGVANLLGSVLTVTGSTLTHNRAQGGGDGDGRGGGLYNGPASDHPSNPGAATDLTFRGSRLAHNAALGGDAGGDGAGGGLWNGGTASVLDTIIDHNRALGGDGDDGGNGFGGGVYNDARASLRLERSTVTENHANGGGGGTDDSSGEGIGGGVYSLRLFNVDALTRIFENHASTSHDDVFDLFG